MKKKMTIEMIQDGGAFDCSVSMDPPIEIENIEDVEGLETIYMVGGLCLNVINDFMESAAKAGADVRMN